MIEQIYENPDIYIIHVPLPNNPLRNLNCYVIKTEEKNLIIDTGFNLEECYNAIIEGITELNLDMTKTEMFLTHLHSDHVGLAGSVMKDNGKIYMSQIDYKYFNDYIQGESWDALDNKFLSEGFPQSGIDTLHSTNPARAFAPNESFVATIVEDGEKINIGGYELTCILTPGHTPGHMCLYMEKEKLIFLGDHILFNISPNITFWNYVDNSLLDYLNSLRLVEKLDVKTALPAHRQNDKDYYERIKELYVHHDIRLEQCLKIIKETPDMNSYDIAGKMQWSMRGKDWTHFPMEQKWFAVGETIAHLDYLEAEGKIEKKLVDGIFLYY